MKKERDKFLTEAMGECWHTFTPSCSNFCLKCSRKGPEGETLDVWVEGRKQTNDFSTWQGFGKLWEWAISQDWWDTFCCGVSGTFASELADFIHPDRFADAVYTFLKERDTEEP